MARPSLASLALFLVGGLVASQRSPQDPAAVWEAALAAKGGRERLASIRSFAVLETTRFRRSSVPDMARGRVWQIVCEPPHALWQFVDYRPGQMGYSVRVVDARTGEGWSTFGGPPKPFLRPDTSAALQINQLQYVYFLETRWVRPKLVSTAHARLGRTAVDRLDADVAGDSVVFFFDAATHLPLRIEASRPPPAAARVREPLKVVYELGEYHDVGGIQVPQRLGRGGDVSQVRVEINPEYDPLIFTTPPSPASTVDSWRARR